MKKRIKIGNWIILILSIIVLVLASSCAEQKVFTQRSSGINGLTGNHTVTKTQRYHNHKAAMSRTKGIFNK